MKVKLIGSTSFVGEELSLQEQVAYVARVSNPNNQHNHKTSGKLVRYLINNYHWSPFQMVNVLMEVNTTRAIARQLLRHRSFAFQEFSLRYALVDDLGDAELVYARLQDKKNRQNSLVNHDEQLNEQWLDIQAGILEATSEAYRWATTNGIAKEVSRVVLTEGLTPSRLYVNGSLRSWIHYLQVRLHISTQKEHRDLALAIYHEILPHFPVLGEVLGDVTK